MLIVMVLAKCCETFRKLFLTLGRVGCILLRLQHWYTAIVNRHWARDADGKVLQVLGLFSAKVSHCHSFILRVIDFCQFRPELATSAGLRTMKDSRALAE